MDFWLLFGAGFLAGFALGATWALLWRDEARRQTQRAERWRRNAREANATVRTIREDVDAASRDAARAVRWASELWASHPLHEDWHTIRALPEVEQ